MHQERVTQLGYLGAEVSDMAAWTPFASGVLGLQPNGSGADGALLLKMDEYHHRLALHPGARDDIAYAGWETPDGAAMQAVAARLQSHGLRVSEGTRAQASERRVAGLIKAEDPNGVINEVYWGSQIEAGQPLRSPRADRATTGGFGGFVAGALGFGHYVLAVDDYEASLRFYRDGLGLLVSDFIELDMGPAGRTTVAFLHSGPRHHSIAIAQFAAPRRLHHIMLQLRNLDDVGTTFDLCQDRRIPIAASLGRHTNDLMTSFYMVTPSGFQVEYGYGGREIDDAAWDVQTHHAASLWGHRSQTATPLLEGPQPA
jgi:2,3-dihydroxybiphenyl 1,2-dioxygenase